MVEAVGPTGAEAGSLPKEVLEQQISGTLQILPEKIRMRNLKKKLTRRILNRWIGENIETFIV